MSNGNCTTHCSDVGTYAFAVIQDTDCYCSDLIPRSQTDISKCQNKCPGYGPEHCGSSADGLFIYIQNGSPSGTAPGPSSAKPTPQPVSSSAIPPPPPPPPQVSTPSTSSTTSTSSTAATTVSAHFPVLQAPPVLILV
jgi:cell wall integrity and stress response component